MGMMNQFEGKNVLVMGYAMTGKSVIEYLLNQGAIVALTAQEDLSQDPSLDPFYEQGLLVVDKGHPLELLDRPWDFIVKNPGIPYSVPFIQAALDKQIPTYTDVEIAGWANPGCFIGITGSNGKTTTTQLIYDIFQKVDDFQTYLAGNIGVPILQSISQMTAQDTLVAELSSFQLEGTQALHPHIAVITNIYQAHLDYHGSINKYRQAKLKLIANMTASDIIIYNYDQDGLHDWLADHPAVKIPVAMTKVDDFAKKAGITCENGIISYQGHEVFHTRDIPIPGDHNIMNVMMAMAASLSAQIDLSKVIEGVTNYQGVAHRIQPIGQFKGRRFYNDSKATNTVATITALKSFQEPVIYIGGGLDRGNGFDDLIPYTQYIKQAYLYGQTKEKMAQSLEKVGRIKIHLLDNLQEATLAAYQAAQENHVVLFSPACASWDQFDNFEERGNVFTDLIHQLITQEDTADNS